MAFLWSLASLISLEGKGHYIHWGIIYLSIANFIVILLMVIAFLAALFVPFPGRASRKESK